MGAVRTSALPAALARVLEEPPREFSPTAIWWWSGEPLRRDRLRWQLERLVEGGVWNVVILNLAPSGPLFGSDADDPPFLSEAWWELLDGVCEDAASLGARIWLYDQLGFSGADLQARLVQEQPEFGGLWLPAGGPGEPEERGFDYLGVEACATLLDRVHGAVERRLGRWLGTTIAGFFQDELPGLPTWSRDFGAAFSARCGYALEGATLELLWTGEGEEAERVRRDYHATRSALAEEAFFKPLNAWHERHGLICGCDQQDPARAGHPVEGVQLYADYARTHRWFGAPGSDHHGDARIHASLAHLYDRPRVWIEAFHSSGWGGTLEETFDWLLPWLRAGATLYNPHAVYATTKAGWWEWAPPSTDWRQPWWRHHGVFADAVARLCAGLSLGRHVCDVAVLLPTAVAQAGARLDGGVSADAAAAQAAYVEVVGDMAWFHQRPGALDRLGLDADVIDDDSLQRAVVSRRDEGGACSAGAGAGGAGAGADAGVGAGAGAGAMSADLSTRYVPESAVIGLTTRLRVADEAYAAVVLPACTVLEDATAARLADFAEAGGVVVALGALPERAVGPDADGGLARLRAAFARGEATFVPEADGLGAALSGLRPRVRTEAPALVREVDGALVVFLTAAFPSATDVTVPSPEERGVGFGWLHPEIDFDPARQRASASVVVRGARGDAQLVSPFGGEPRTLAGTRDGDGLRFEVPFDDGPAALLVLPAEAFGAAADAGCGADAAGADLAGADATAADAADEPSPAVVQRQRDSGVGEPDAVLDLGATWECELVGTLENDWGDFARPASPGAPAPERWALRRRVERAGEDGLCDRWALPGHDDAAEPWTRAHATFGPHAIWCGPAAPERLPAPGAGSRSDAVAAADAARPADAADLVDEAGAAADAGPLPAWREAEWSLSRGIFKDRIHQGGTLGPKGHVPEEFLDFGRVAAGEAVQVRLRLDVPAGEAGTLVVGAAAAKQAWVDGAALPLEDGGGHLAVAPFALGEGAHEIELRLEPDRDLDLRAHFALVRDVDRYRRPEWIAAEASAAAAPAGAAPAGAAPAGAAPAGAAPAAAAPATAAPAGAAPAGEAPRTAAPGSRVTLLCDVFLREAPASATVQVASKVPCRLRVNGAEVGRQGGFDPYAEQDVARVGRYDVAARLRAGRNVLAVELVETGGEPAAVLVDALLGETTVASGPAWRALRDGLPADVLLRRETSGDPAALHLVRRPHPLPGAAWLDPDADDGTVLPLVPALPESGGGVKWLRFAIPPGTARVDAEIHGRARLFVDGVETALGGPLPASADGADAPPPARTGALRIETAPGREGGAALAGPIRFQTGPGRIALGDWQHVGLPEHSGGVRYRTTVTIDRAAGTPARARLHLGAVRGTAEVTVNGEPAGTRICAPYAFDVTEHLTEGENAIEILVLGTLGPYLDAVSPTHFVFDGQLTSGLLGPVTLEQWRGAR